MTDKLDKLLIAANSRLKLSRTGITIFRRGNKLSLRGMLPPKPGSGKDKPSQQTIALGYYANAAGIKVAESEALKLSSAIALREFDWSNYLKNTGYGNTRFNTVEHWVAKFEKDYFNRRERNSKSESTFKDYQKIFKKFDKGAPLNTDTLMAVVLSTSPDTRTRKKACIYLKALAEFADIDFDPSRFAGNYSADSVELRNIPTDKEIQEWYDRIPKAHGWKYAFGLMAAYGLRNYELFYIDFDSLKQSPGHLRIVESKRNKKIERLIWCLYPEWWEMWDLGNIKQPFPTVTGKTNSDLGDRVLKAFKRYGFSKPYNLRHAWAIRAINFVPVEMAAKMMDHSVIIHTKTYQRWINNEHYEKIYQQAINRVDRPLPPNF